MPRSCECGGSILSGAFGSKCASCGKVAEGVVAEAPCACGSSVAGVNRCHSDKIAQEKRADVYVARLDSRCPMDETCPGFAPNENLKAAFGKQECAYLKDGNCVQPTYDTDSDGTYLPPTKVITVGKCPFFNDVVAQQDCSLSKPDPSWPQHSWTPFDMVKTSSKSQILAHWNDVRAKAVRLRNEGKVHLTRNDSQVITAVVQGDHGTYNTVVYRQDPDSWSVSNWECDCGWGSWAFKRQHTYVGRLCSHAAATLYESQAQNMQGGGNLLWHENRAASVGDDDVLHNSGVDSGRGSDMGDDYLPELIVEACKIALVDGFDTEASLFLEKNLGRVEAESMLLDYVDEPNVVIDGRVGEERFRDKSGKFAHVEFEDGTSGLYPVAQLQREAQAITVSFRNKVQSAIQSSIGAEIEGLVVRFSEHWSQRVTGEFSCQGELYEYEYTQSTSRVIVNKIVEGLHKGEVEGYTEKTATRFFSYGEQQEIQDESLGQLARNLSQANIEGTHYVLDSDDDGGADGSDMSWLWS